MGRLWQARLRAASRASPLGTPGEGSKPPTPSRTPTARLQLHQHPELSGDSAERASAGGCSALPGRAGASHNSIFSRGFQGICLPALPTESVITSALLTALFGADFWEKEPKKRGSREAWDHVQTEAGMPGLEAAPGLCRKGAAALGTCAPQKQSCQGCTRTQGMPPAGCGVISAQFPLAIR